MDTAILASLIGGLIGAAATFFTGIIAVGVTIWQIRKTQNNIIKDSYSKLLEERRAIMLVALEEPSIRKWILNNIGLENIPEDKEKLYFLTLLDIDHYSHVYYRYKRGLFPKELWPTWRYSMIGSFNTPLYQEIWNSRFSAVVSKEFREYKNDSFPDI